MYYIIPSANELGLCYWLPKGRIMHSLRNVCKTDGTLNAIKVWYEHEKEY